VDSPYVGLEPALKEQHGGQHLIGGQPQQGKAILGQFDKLLGTVIGALISPRIAAVQQEVYNTFKRCFEHSVDDVSRKFATGVAMC